MLCTAKTNSPTLKWSLLLIVLLIPLLSINVLAATDRSIEKQWENFIATANLKYEQSEGKTILDLGVEQDSENLLKTLKPEYLKGDIKVGYGVLPNMQIQARYFRDYYQEKISQIVYTAWLQQLSAGAKYKFFDQSGLTLAVAGSVYLLNGEETLTIWGDKHIFPVEVKSVGTTVYSLFRPVENFTLYNNFELLSGKTKVNKTMINGIGVSFGPNHALRVKSEISFTKLEEIECTVSALFKSSYENYFTILLGVSKRIKGLDESEPGFSLTNTVETAIIPAVLLRGSFKGEKGEDFVVTTGIEVEKKLGLLNLVAGYSYVAPHGEYPGDGTFRVGINSEIGFGSKR